MVCRTSRNPFSRSIIHGIAIDSLLFTIVKLVTMGVSIIITMLLSKKFSLTDYGIYSQAIIIISLGSSLSILGLTDAANYFYNRTKNQKVRENYISTIFFIQLLIGLICAATIVGFQKQISQYFNNPNLRYIYQYIAFMPLIGNILSIYQVLYLSVGKAKFIAFRNFIISILKLSSVILACFITQNIITVIILMMIIDLLQLSYFVYNFNKNSSVIKLKESKLSLVPTILSYSIPVASYIVTDSLCREMDKLVIGRLTNTETLAIYANCAKILPFDVLTISFGTVLIPIITRFVSFEQHEKGQHLFRNYLQLSYITTFILAFGAIIVAPELISFLYDKKYLPGLWVFIVFIVVAMVRFANISIILSAKGETVLLMVYSASALVTNLIFSILFFHIWGIIGPAISTLLVTLSVNVLILLNGAKILRSSISNLINFKEMGSFLLELIVIGIFIYGVRLFLINHGVNSLLVLFISYGLFLLGVGLLNAKKIIYLLKELNKIKV